MPSYLDDRIQELRYSLQALKENPDPEENKNASYIIRHLLNLGSNVVNGQELIQSVLSSNFIAELVTKFQTSDTGLAGACADMIQSMFQFIIENNNIDNNDKESEEIKEEPDIPMDLYGEMLSKQKLELQLDEFLDTFAFNIPKLLKFLLTPQKDT